MHGAWKDILGKTIQAVITADNPGDLRSQVFLVFSDDTSLEIFGQQFRCARSLEDGGLAAAVQYANRFDGAVQVIVG